MTSSDSELEYLIVISPLGMLYGSAGPFLSPENLVGRAGDRFPPSATTVAGLYGATKWTKHGSLNNLYIVGPFWAERNTPQNFYVPTPMNFWVKYDEAHERYVIRNKQQCSKDGNWSPLRNNQGEKIKEKKTTETWVAINNWHHLQSWPSQTAGSSPLEVRSTHGVWCHHPHLHPRLDLEQRRVVAPLNNTTDDVPAQQGSLFLENGVQLHPDYCLVYLASMELDDGWYRFGGEGHLAEVECKKIKDNWPIKDLLQQPVGECFSLLTPAVWGTQRLSYRFPVPNGSQLKDPPDPSQKSPSPTLHPVPSCIQPVSDNAAQSFWLLQALMTGRPIPFRFRLGGEGRTKRLSRGRYGVPAGTVYQLAEAINDPWQRWQHEWFPLEGYSYKHWGCGFALPL
jgi:CRISPR-associated protein Cmr3